MAENRVIIDTGPLVAFLVKDETHHQWVMEQFQRLPAPFLTCEAEQLAVYEAIARKVTPADYGPLSDEALTAIAAETFALLDEE